MTTIKTLKLQCPSCSGRFYANILASFGFSALDEHLCKKYWGFNPMLLFYAMCPHCKHVDYPLDFIELDESEEDLPFSPETCEKYDLLVEKEIEGENQHLSLAYYYHQAACCRKIQEEEYSEYLKKAHHYFVLAKQDGVDEFFRKSIDDWISATDV